MSSTPSPKSSLTWSEVVLLALFAAGQTVLAWNVYPQWDDCQVWLVEREGGAAAARHSVADRPLVGWLWERFSEADLLLPVSLALHWLTWFAMACVSARLWMMCFATQRRLALAVGLLALAPIICRGQFNIVNLPIFSVLGSVLVYAAALLWGRRDVSGRSEWLLGGVALSMVALACALSEYGVAAAAGAAVLLFGPLAPVSAERSWRRRMIRPLLILATAAVTYLVYLQFADLSHREDVDPARLAAAPLWRIKTMLPRLVTLLWDGALGAALRGLAAIRLNTNESVLAIAAALPLAVIAALCARRAPSETSARHIEAVPAAVLSLLFALFMGLLPALLMGRMVTDERYTSRYWLPVLPVAACLTVAVLGYVLRSRLAFIVTPLCAVVAGYALVFDALMLMESLDYRRAWGREVEAHLAPEGMNVAIFVTDWPDAHWHDRLLMPREWQLVAQMTQDWRSENRLRFMAFANLPRGHYLNRLQGVEGPGLVDQPYLDYNFRGWQRTGEVNRLLWLHVQFDGSIVIQQEDVN